MKVSTDACIQGAWAAAEFAKIKKPEARVLDIGTGTGLLTLMMAQALRDAQFDAIEINKDAYEQAVYNFEISDWKRNLNAIHTSLSDFTASSGNIAKYDFIICNPPFFQNHLESQSKARNDARHSQSLSKEALANAVVELLKEEGIFCVMFPETEWDSWVKTAREKGLYILKQLTVSPAITSKPNRIIGLMKKGRRGVSEVIHFQIYDAERNYTESMKILLRDYYLAF